MVNGPQPLGDPNALPANGDRYLVTLSGMDAPPAGTILLATGTARIAGRVVTSSAAADDVQIEYELVPLPQLLARYSFAFDIPLDPRDAGLEPVATLNHVASVGGVPARPDAVFGDEVKAEKEAKFTRGPLECKASAAAKFKSTEFDIKATTDLSLQVEGRKEIADTSTPEHTKVVLSGPLALDVFGGLRAEAGFDGSAGCELKKHIPIPLGGVLAVVLAVTVPIGLSATAEGKVKAVDLELGPKGHIGTNVTIGFQCDTNACWAITDHTPDQNNGISFESKVNLLRDMRVEANVSVNLVTGLGFKVGTGEYSLIDAKIGPVQAMNLALDDAQVRDPSYASNYDLKIAGSVAPGEALKTAISRVFGGEVTLDLSAKYASDPIFSSPKGTLSAEKPRVQVGKPVALYVDLDPKTMDYFLIGPNVAEVRVARWKDDALTPIASIPITASGQTRFEYVWTPTKDFVGMNELVAFVVTNGLPSVPLEIAPDSTAYVEVVEACIGDPATPPPVQPPAASARPSGAPAPVVTPPPPDPCARGTVTITREKHGTYTSNRNNPVQVNMTDTATITFDLVPDQFDDMTLVSSAASITWSYSMNAVESGDGCTIVEKADGGGTWGGDGGPSVLLGWAAPDGTPFGMVIDDSRYVLQALPPSNSHPDGDPRSYYRGSSSFCGADFISGIQFPYTTLALVDGLIPEGGTGTFSGSRQRTLPPLNSLDLPTVETVTWSFSVDGAPAP